MRRPPIASEDLHQVATRLRSISPLSDATVHRLSTEFQRRQFGAGEHLLRGGERARDIYLVLAGLVREYQLDERGVEHTRSFASAGGITGSLFDLLEDKPSVTWLQALAPTVTLALPYRHFAVLSETNMELTQLARRAVELLYMRKARREYELLALSAKQRLHSWLQTHSDLDSRISRQLLASYLGITPVHLSRLRRHRSG